jgi:hypothetical protein
MDRYLTHAPWRREHWKEHGGADSVRRVLAYAERKVEDTPKIFELAVYADGTCAYTEISPARFAV